MPRLATRRFLRLAAVLTLLAGGTGCGRDGEGTPHSSTTSAADAAAQRPAEGAPADPAVRFFHDQLVVNGEDVQSDFGGYLLTLGMNPRDLQQDTPEHAYQTVLQRVRDVQDVALRRDMSRTFFGTDATR